MVGQALAATEATARAGPVVRRAQPATEARAARQALVAPPGWTGARGAPEVTGEAVVPRASTEGRGRVAAGQGRMAVRAGAAAEWTAAGTPRQCPRSRTS
jgi:hypothetical protein